MIDTTDFVSKWLGMYVEVSGTDAPNQCVDWVNLYIRDFLHQPMIEWTNAKDFPSKAGDKYLWIPNTLTNVPEEGDIMVWDGVWGHVGVFLDGNVNDFHSIDENYPTGTPVHIQYHNYTNVKGWLRLKTPPVAECDPHWRIERDDNYNLYLAEKAKVEALTKQLADKKSIIDRIREFLGSV